MELREGEERKNGDGDVDMPGALRRLAGGSGGSAAAGRGGGVEKDGVGGKGKKGPKT